MFAIVKEQTESMPLASSVSSYHTFPHTTDINPLRTDQILPMLIQTLKAAATNSRIPDAEFQQDQEG
jgi:hypothetical protein